MFEKLEEIEKKYNQLTEKISDTETIANQEIWKKCMKERSRIEEVVEKICRI